MTIGECARSSPWWGVVKSLELIGSGPVGLVHTQNFQFFLKQKTHFWGRKLQDDLWRKADFVLISQFDP